MATGLIKAKSNAFIATNPGTNVMSAGRRKGTMRKRTKRRRRKGRPLQVLKQ